MHTVEWDVEGEVIFSLVSVLFLEAPKNCYTLLKHTHTHVHVHISFRRYLEPEIGRGNEYNLRLSSSTTSQTSCKDECLIRVLAPKRASMLHPFGTLFSLFVRGNFVLFNPDKEMSHDKYTQEIQP